ncbi:MAG: hypothetical protein QME74_02255, partial [Candidatus Edwardsbacteria bacterium]|nr:hypothetical protein [Candidatus Edwardsbacteria bacterium]
MAKPATPDIFEWTVHPVRESAAKAVIAIAFPLIAAALVFLLMQSWFWTLLGLILLVASEFPFFIKTKYTFDDQGATMKRGGVTISKKWDQIGSYYPDKNGVQLSPYLKPFWMENFRGLYLQFGG